MKANYELGSKATEKITGFSGVITGKASYLTGCDQYLVQPPCKDGAFVEGQWFDEARLVVGSIAVEPESVQGAENGACGKAPKK